VISKKGVITRLPPIASSAEMPPAQPPQQPASRMKQSILAAIQASNIRPAAEGMPSATPDGLAEVGAPRKRCTHARAPDTRTQNTGGSGHYLVPHVGSVLSVLVSTHDAARRTPPSVRLRPSLA
jgi:hypothetical protein